MSVLIEGEWCQHEGGYALKLGEIFLGKIRQKGGGNLDATCWVVTLNQYKVQEVGNDPDYARGLVERWICDELRRIVPAYERIRARVPPPECFWGQDHGTFWYNWKEDRAVEGWTFQRPTPRQLHAALKRKE